MTGSQPNIVAKPNENMLTCTLWWSMSGVHQLPGVVGRHCYEKGQFALIPTKAHLKCGADQVSRVTGQDEKAPALSLPSGRQQQSTGRLPPAPFMSWGRRWNGIGWCTSKIAQTGRSNELPSRNVQQDSSLWQALCLQRGLHSRKCVRRKVMTVIQIVWAANAPVCSSGHDTSSLDHRSKAPAAIEGQRVACCRVSLVYRKSWQNKKKGSTCKIG